MCALACCVRLNVCTLDSVWVCACKAASPTPPVCACVSVCSCACTRAHAHPLYVAWSPSEPCSCVCACVYALCVTRHVFCTACIRQSVQLYHKCPKCNKKVKLKHLFRYVCAHIGM